MEKEEIEEFSKQIGDLATKKERERSVEFLELQLTSLEKERERIRSSIPLLTDYLNAEPNQRRKLANMANNLDCSMEILNAKIALLKSIIIVGW